MSSIITSIFIIYSLLTLSAISFGQDNELRFAGFVIGLDTSDVVNKLKNQESYLVYLRENKRCSNFIITSEHEDYFNYPKCMSQHLVMLDPEYSETRYISQMKYGNQEIDYPRFYFYNNKLTQFDCSLTTSVRAYFALIEQLKNKFGNPVKNNNKYREIKFIYNNVVLELSDNSAYNKLINRKECTVRTSISLYNKMDRDKCEQTIKTNYDTFINKLISIDDTSISLLGIRTGIDKSEALKYLVKRYRIMNNISDYEGIPYHKYPDEFKMVINSYDGHSLEINLKFYKNKLETVYLRKKSCSHRLCNQFIKVVRDYIKIINDRCKGKKIKIFKDPLEKNGPRHESLNYTFENDELQLNSYDYASDDGYSPAAIVLTDMSASKKRKNEAELPVMLELTNIFSQLKYKKLFGIKLLSSPFIYSNFQLSEDSETSKYDVFDNCFWFDVDPNTYVNTKSISIDISNSNNWGKLRQNISDNRIIDQRCINIILSNNRIVSLSTYLDIINDSEVRDLYSEVSLTDCISKVMTSLYGEPSISVFNKRNIMYWIINDNLFVLDDHSISFRTYRKDDIILTRIKNHNLLD